METGPRACSLTRDAYAATFKAHYLTLLSLKRVFPFTLVDACGTLAETEAQIARELRYQSSLELSGKAYEFVRQVPLATHLANDARRALVARLDTAARRHNALLADVVHLIITDLVPVLSHAALSGRATYLCDKAGIMDDPHAREIFTDLLSDRGFGVEYECSKSHVPVRVCLQTGSIECSTLEQHRFSIVCERALLRSSNARSVSQTNALLTLPSFDPTVALPPAAAGLAAAGNKHTAPQARMHHQQPHRALHESDVSEVQVM